MAITLNPEMIYPEIPLAQTLIALCKAEQIRDIVLSPGSRNAPLILGFSSDPYFRVYSIVDERSAGFFALGIAQKTGQPTAVVCTSGSALINYYPAVCEAFYSDIPLVVISADRPPHMIDIGDGQTIRQPGVLDHHLLGSAALKADIRKTSELSVMEGRETDYAGKLSGSELQDRVQEFNSAQIRKMLRLARSGKGPVHLNAPFEEPLYGTLSSPSVHIAEEKAEGNNVKAGFELPEGFAEAWNKASKKMILAGVMEPGSLSDQLLNALSEDPNLLILKESTSNLYHPVIVGNIDQLIAPLEKSASSSEEFEALRPEILLTFGGMVVSKKIKAFLRKYQPARHWHVDVKKAYDTYFCLSQHFVTEPETMVQHLVARPTEHNSGYRDHWLRVRDHRKSRHAEYLREIPYSDFKAYASIWDSLPEKLNLHLSNSSTIRYAQLFDARKGWEVYCNRGTSGIEGSSSTAAGSAVIASTQTVLITGDLSFFYDSNGLWHQYLRPDFRIVMINNQGGGIFRILPGDKHSSNFERYLETVHHYDAEGICRTFGIQYLKVETESELNNSLKTFFTQGDGPALLEIKTPRTLNDEVLLNYFKYLV